MTLPVSPLSIALVATLSWIAAHAVLRVVTARGVLDAPNHRSSHATPTPRGGGVAFVALGTVALMVVGWRTAELAPWALASVGAAIAWIGWHDDVDGVPSSVRLGSHLAAALTLLLCAWPFATLGLGVGWSIVLLPVAVVGVAWIVSVVNFMDGIDGLAASHAMLVALAASLIFAQGAAAGPAMAAALVAAAITGFLALNWPPARIFMGDIGSGWIGVALAGLAIWSVREAGAAGLWPWLILGAAFITDATVCLVRRILTRQPFTEPHRSHAYQNLARLIGSHRKVTLAYLVVGAVWLVPLAAIAAAHPTAGPALTVIAYLPLIELALRLRSGVPGVAERGTPRVST